jgi:hypothetical protein
MQQKHKKYCPVIMKKILLLTCFVAIAVLSCKKNKAESVICTAAAIQYAGDPAVDGLGWIMITDSVYSFKYESPDNLSDPYKINGLPVDVCYVITDKDFVCFCAPPLKKKVHITSIKPH